MNPVSFPGQQAVIGAKQGYRPLPIERITIMGPLGPIHTYNSKWKPDADELKKLNEGGTITLMVRTLGDHPPVKLEVE